MKFPTTEAEWRSIARVFEAHCNIPNCIGAVDGKHVNILPPPNSGAYYYNYKGYNSLVLMAICDANCEFIIRKCGKSHTPSECSDQENIMDSTVQVGLGPDSNIFAGLHGGYGRNFTREANQVRQLFTQYLNQEGAVSWQERMIHWPNLKLSNL
ncbi:unnamed protein product [Acanthoscelides obtectus]|uniref:DDE Tnp4 domain-containing protein n=1 Tax=Acanthoscelides obtectus TaxID=200917 RepID=A0A9P0Q3B3_ACAOB|nr:unnamed protein product [Acanthoscelides obtectus]CAK1687720.1 hypothetical protein AOBTE_LOCUS36336 [Acanthoscelides obtectus]